MKILHDNVLIKRNETEETTKSGIILSPSTIDQPSEGVVTHVGPGYDLGVKQYKMTVKPGDRVLFHKHAGTDVKVDGETLRLLPESNIIGIFE